MTPVRLEPAALRSRVKHSTTEPLRSQFMVAGYPDMTVHYITLYKAMCSIRHDSSNTVLIYDEGYPDMAVNYITLYKARCSTFYNRRNNASSYGCRV